MQKIVFGLMLFLLVSCNHIETGDSLDKATIARIQTLHLLDKGETIYKFYSEFKSSTAGNFFTNKRIATYWVNGKNTEKTNLDFTFYNDISRIDTVFNAGLTYSPYMLITKADGTTFKVSVNGTRNEIQSFFEDAMQQWQLHK